MKGLLKRISFVLALLFMMLFTTNVQIAAEGQSENKGKMYFKTERIDQGKNERKHQNIETELDKVFPTLFHEETTQTINFKKDEEEKLTYKLEQSLFEVPGNPDTVLNDIKNETLFTVDYMPPKTSKVNEITEEGQASSMSKGVFASLLGLLLVLCGGVYTMLLKL